MQEDYNSIDVTTQLLLLDGHAKRKNSFHPHWYKPPRTYAAQKKSIYSLLPREGRFLREGQKKEFLSV
jgi:hypothetical protein